MFGNADSWKSKLLTICWWERRPPGVAHEYRGFQRPPAITCQKDKETQCFGLPHTGRSSFTGQISTKGFLHWQRGNHNLHDKGQTTLEIHSLLLSWQNVLENMTSSISEPTLLLSRACLLLKDLKWYYFHLVPYFNAGKEAWLTEA